MAKMNQLFFSRLFTVAILLIVASGFFLKKNPAPKEVVNKIVASIENIDRVSFHMRKWERYGTRLHYSESEVKLSVSPFKLYMNIIGGYRKGYELLWVDGENGGKILVKPSSFPYVNLDLDPNGYIMRESEHHSIFDAGFTYAGQLIRASVNKLGEKYYNYLKIRGDTLYDNRSCFGLLFSYPDFKFTEYTVKKGETIEAIAAKSDVNDYMIRELNGKLNILDRIQEGEKLKVPNLYAKKVFFLIDKESYLPIVQIVIDDKGIYERYEFHSLKVNPVFKDNEFSRSNKEYGFE